MKKLYLLFPLFFVIIASSACHFGQGEPTQTGGSGEVLFQDDFSDEASGWYTFLDQEGVTDYQDGGFRIFVDVANTYHWTNPEKTFGDVQVEVDARKISGPEENDFGLICRYQDDANFYFFTISSDGYYGIAKFVDGEEILVGAEDLGFDDAAIKSGQATNHVRADCVGNTLTLYANGQQLIQAQDDEFTEGDVGLIASTYDVVGTDMLFDNFVVTQP